MVSSSGKCHFMCFGQNTVNETVVYDNTGMKNSKEKKIQEVITNNVRRFKVHIKNVAKILKRSPHLINYLNNSEQFQNSEDDF